MRALPCLVAILSLAACATDPAEDDGPDGAGDGKTDDPTCESAAYQTWLKDSYLPQLRDLGLPLTSDALPTALAAAGEKPCTTGSDADFAHWFAAFDQTITPLVERLAPAGVRSQEEYDAHVAGAVATEQEDNTLTALIVASPLRSGAAGYKLWLDRYEAVLYQAYVGAGMGTLVFERNAELNAAEQPLVKALEDARPEASQERSYAAWFPIYEKWHAIGYAPTAAPQAVNFTSRIVLQRPTARGDIDYLTFFQAFDAKETAAYATAASATPAALAELAQYIAVRPRGLTETDVAGGARSFAPWFSAFVSRFTTTLGGDAVLTADETARLERFIAAKPCTTNVDGDLVAWNNLDARRDRLGDAARFVDLSKPTACATE